MIIKRQRLNITIVEKLIVTALLTQISWANHLAITSKAKISVKLAKSVSAVQARKTKKKRERILITVLGSFMWTAATWKKVLFKLVTLLKVDAY